MSTYPLSMIYSKAIYKNGERLEVAFIRKVIKKCTENEQKKSTYSPTISLYSPSSIRIISSNNDEMKVVARNSWEELQKLGCTFYETFFIKNPIDAITIHFFDLI